MALVPVLKKIGSWQSQLVRLTALSANERTASPEVATEARNLLTTIDLERAALMVEVDRLETLLPTDSRVSDTRAAIDRIVAGLRRLEPRRAA